MNVIVEFDGREAIPVRAIPFLTDWIHMSPDHVAAALSGDLSFHWSFVGLTAMSIEHGCITPIPATWWQSFSRRKLKALKDRIEQSQISHETGYQEWQNESIQALPPGTFVWKDEYELLYYRYVAPRSAVSYEVGDELRPRYIKLQFNPFVPDQDLVRMVMDGFESASKMVGPEAIGVFNENRDDWKVQAQTMAMEFIGRQRASDLFPSQMDIADEIAEVFRRTNVVGSGGKPLSGSYIKRHALKGISSEQGKQISTKIVRGK